MTQRTFPNASTPLHAFLQLLFVAACSLSAGCISQTANSNKSVWLPFDRDEVNRSLDRGDWVVLFGNPLYHLDGAALAIQFDTKEWAAMLKQSRAKFYYIEYTGSEPIAEELMELTYKTYSPILAILHSSQTPQYFSISELERFRLLLERLAKNGSR